MFYRRELANLFNHFMALNRPRGSGTRNTHIIWLLLVLHSQNMISQWSLSILTVVSLAIFMYVDDILVAGDSLHDISTLKKSLDSTFMIKDLVEIRFFLELEICRTQVGLHINQRKSSLDILKQAGPIRAKPLSITFPSNIHLDKALGNLLSDPTLYRQIVGCLL